jgi:hypothetical protein
MAIDSDILYKEPNELYEALKGLKEIQATFIGILLNQMEIDPKKRAISSEKQLEYLKALLKDKTLEEYRPTIYSQPAWVLREVGGALSFEQVPHYFLVCDDTGAVIDIFAWRLDIPLNYKDSTMTRYTPPASDARANPFGESYYYSDTTPIVLWMSIRAIFVGDSERRRGEDRNAFINRLYREQKRKNKLSRKDVLAKLYRIAISSLQKKGYLEKGTRFATADGKIRGLEYAEYLGERDFDGHFKDFEAIIELSRGADK